MNSFLEIHRPTALHPQLVKMLSTKQLLVFGFERSTNFHLSKAPPSPQKFRNFWFFTLQHILKRSAGDLVEFEIIWTFLSNHTTQQQQRDILRQTYKLTGNETISRHKDNLIVDDLYSFNFHQFWLTSVTSYFPETVNFTFNLYQSLFSDQEIQEQLTNSNDFMPFGMSAENAKDFCSQLEGVFEGNEGNCWYF